MGEGKKRREEGKKKKESFTAVVSWNKLSTSTMLSVIAVSRANPLRLFWAHNTLHGFTVQDFLALSNDFYFHCNIHR